MNKLKNKRIENTGIFIQILLLVLIFITLIDSLFLDSIRILFDWLIIFFLLVLSYNNYTLYRRKYFTLLYFIAAVLWFILCVLGIQIGI